MKFLLKISFIFLFISGMCSIHAQNKVTTSISEIPKYKVVVFYSTTCPICQKMTLTLNQIYKQYKDSNISFQIIFPSVYDNKKNVSKFNKKYKLEMECIIDENHVLVNKYNAIVTPECFLIDENQQVVYSGKLDNWFYEIGKYRQIITENYLKDAINSLLRNQPILLKRTEPIGCFINKE